MTNRKEIECIYPGCPAVGLFSYTKRCPEHKDSCLIPGCIKTRRDKAFCPMHLMRKKTHGEYGSPEPLRRGWGQGTEWHIDGKGYVRRHWQVDNERYTSLQHREVMEKHLGRKLRPDEGVHHKDGNRANNDLSNLELTTKQHFSGARVIDLLQRAREIIALYEKDEEKL